MTSLVAGAMALAIPLLPSLAQAQEPYGGWREAPPPPQEYTQVRVTPPSYGIVYLYEGRRFVGRFDRPGALWLPSGRNYRVVAVRGDQPVWSGYRYAVGQVLELRWPVAGEPCTCSPPLPPPALTSPEELGRTRTPRP
jgi:hypothetical protein